MTQKERDELEGSLRRERREIKIEICTLEAKLLQLSRRVERVLNVLKHPTSGQLDSDQIVEGYPDGNGTQASDIFYPEYEELHKTWNEWRQKTRRLEQIEESLKGFE